jgi:hypothetical protein
MDLDCGRESSHCGVTCVLASPVCFVCFCVQSLPLKSKKEWMHRQGVAGMMALMFWLSAFACLVWHDISGVMEKL